METVHVINLEKYQPGYKDRHHRWSKVHYDILLDPDYQQLHEIDRYRYLSLILYETFLMGKPLVLTPTNLAILGWDKKKRAISLSLQMLHTFVECVTDVSNERAVDKSRVEKSRVYKKEESKDCYAEFVLLTKEEHSKLIDKLGETLTASLIEELNDYVGSKGVQYKSHYHTILAWSRRRLKEDSPAAVKKIRLFPIAGKVCGECGLPAVYKTSGDYDFWYCAEHMPAKVKEKYA